MARLRLQTRQSLLPPPPPPLAKTHNRRSPSRLRLPLPRREPVHAATGRRARVLLTAAASSGRSDPASWEPCSSRHGGSQASRTFQRPLLPVVRSRVERPRAPTFPFQPPQAQRGSFLGGCPVASARLYQGERRRWWWRCRWCCKEGGQKPRGGAPLLLWPRRVRGREYMGLSAGRDRDAKSE